MLYLLFSLSLIARLPHHRIFAAELVDELGMKDKPKVIDLTTEEVTVGSLTEAQISCQKSEKVKALHRLLPVHSRM